MMTVRYRATPVRVVELDGRVWLSGADVLRALGVDVSRRGASPYLRPLPSSEVRVVAGAELDALFKGRRGFPQMSLISKEGLRLLLGRLGEDPALHKDCCTES
jgi:prophage antirepressor-like protein